MLENGALVVSLDTELEWGFNGFEIDHHLSDDGTRERELVRRLLDLFDRTDTLATWTVVGHLFLDRCDGTHSELAVILSTDERRLVSWRSGIES